MSNVFDQFEYNTTRGPNYMSDADLPSFAPETRARLVAFYLPQFHQVVENDQWWGPGFTEWTNVTKALPRYRGHRSPRLPADLGFYDLASSDIMRKQGELAKRAGIHGFCLHHYWFNGRQILETPINTLLSDKTIEINFCLSWANENWSRRWDGFEQDVLLQQVYDSEDPAGYVRSIIEALADPRYITVDGRPLILVYRPALIPNAPQVFKAWRSYLVSEGLPNPYLVMVQNMHNSDPRPFGLDGAAGFPPHNVTPRNHRRAVKLLDRRFKGRVAPYDDLAELTRKTWESPYPLFPGVAPGWDNDARKPNKSMGFFGASPQKYEAWLSDAVSFVRSNKPEERLIFVNAWNEWAEGAILEPDQYFGHAFLVATRNAASVQCGPTTPWAVATAVPDSLSEPKISPTRHWIFRQTLRIRDIFRKRSTLKAVLIVDRRGDCEQEERE